MRQKLQKLREEFGLRLEYIFRGGIFMKSSTRKKLLLMIIHGMLFNMTNVQALPVQGNCDNSTSAIINTATSRIMTVTGLDTNNVINWTSFNIGKGETVQFTGDKNYLNLVHGVDMSRISGTISGGNIVYLVNPNGILFSEGAKLDNVGSFVASSRNLSSINLKEFLSDPTNTAGVLGVDDPKQDNKNYYPNNGLYVPKITVENINYTLVPKSANIILDGPRGIILKDSALLGYTKQVITRKNGGEIGIGTVDGTVSLYDYQKDKITLVDGDKYWNFAENTNVLKGYRILKDWYDFNNDNNSDRLMITENGKFNVLNLCHPANGNYYFESKKAPGKVMTGNNLNGNLTIFEQNNKENQRFYVSRVDNDYYRIIAENNNLAVNNHNGMAVDNNLITMYYDMNDCQRWRFYMNTEGYFFVRAKTSGWYTMDVYDNRTANNERLALYSLNGSASQQWKMKRSDSLVENIPVQDIVQADRPNNGILNNEYYNKLQQEKMDNMQNNVVDTKLQADIARFDKAQYEAQKAFDRIMRIEEEKKAEDKRKSYDTKFYDSKDKIIESISGKLTEYYEEKGKQESEELKKVSDKISGKLNLDWIPEKDRILIVKEIAKHIYESNTKKIGASSKEISLDSPKSFIEYVSGIVSAYTSSDKFIVHGDKNYTVKSDLGSNVLTIQCGTNKYTFSEPDQKVLNKAVGNYCYAMAKLNTEAWSDVVINCVVPSSGMLSTNKIKKLAEDVLNDKCSEEVKKYIPGGDKIIEIIDGYKQLQNEYAEINNLITDTDDNSYTNFEKTLGMLNNMLNKLN
mgnify:FL=1